MQYSSNASIEYMGLLSANAVLISVVDKSINKIVNTRAFRIYSSNYTIRIQKCISTPNFTTSKFIIYKIRNYSSDKDNKMK